MPVYEYRARNRVGELVTGTYEASDMSDVVHMIRNKGFYPVFIEEFRQKPGGTLMKAVFRKVSKGHCCVLQAVCNNVKCRHAHTGHT